MWCASFSSRPALIGIMVCLIPVAAVGIELSSVSGVVRDSQGPVPGATVRVAATSVSTVTNSAGEFTLRLASELDQLTLTASAPGFFIAGPVRTTAGSRDIELRLARQSPTRRNCAIAA